MKITMEATDRFTRVDNLECRVWKGKTDGGVECTVYVVRIQVPVDQTAQFDRELIEQPPRSIVYDPSIPLRLIL